MQNQNLTDFLTPYVSNQYSKQVNDLFHLDRIMEDSDGEKRILDLGCGEGKTYFYCSRKWPTCKWNGLEIRIRDTVPAEIRPAILEYDGVKIPFPGKQFDIVYCHQVFEHVLHPRALLSEVKRVLKPGGYFVGSLSYLEPYHARSLWNYTPFGVVTLFEEAGFSVTEINPGIDGPTLFIRRLLGRQLSRVLMIFPETPFNILISLMRFVAGRNHRWANIVKLLFSGHIVFLARNPTARPLS